MNGLPYYKRYPRDFIEGTIGLPFELKTTYAFILDLIYMQNGDLPDDDRYISGLLGVSVRKWNSLRQGLIDANKLHVSGKYLKNYRAIIELENTVKLQDKMRENASGARKNKGLQKPKLSHTDTDTYIKEDTSVSSKKCIGFAELAFVLDDGHAQAVIDHRRKIKKPLTAHAAKLLASKFGQTANPNAAADHMISNGWQGFEPDWVSGKVAMQNRVGDPYAKYRSQDWKIMRNGDVYARRGADDDWMEVSVPADAVAPIAMFDYRQKLEAVG